MANMQIQHRAVEDLHPRAGNPRTHSKKQIEQIAASIRRFGFLNPILIDRDDGVVAGHGRLAAAQLLGLGEVPTLRLEKMSKAEVRAYVIADNRLAEKAGWDRDLLRIEFEYLADLKIDFDLTVTGFDLAEIEGITAANSVQTGKDDRLDHVPATEQVAVTCPGDVWQIGTHRLICGDATLPETYDALLAQEQATMVFSDPPFNVPIQGHVSGLGEVQHREFAMASGEMTSFEFASFLGRAFNNAARVSTDGSIHFHCMDWRHAREILEAGDLAYDELKNVCVWSKTNAGMGSLYRSAHELVFVFKRGKAAHINNVELGKNGRYRTNVWHHAGANSFGRSRDKELAMHPTVKPVAMIYNAMLDCSRRGDIVLDPFAGSGTTLVAAQKAKRRGYAIELDPLYCDVAVRRMRDLFKIEATLAADSRSFDQVTTDRAANAVIGEAA